MSQEIESLTAVVAMQQQAIEAQAKQIGELATHVGLLVQCVAQSLGEETGHPVRDQQGQQDPRVDLDGNPY